jgi:hypothetical protein
MNFKTAIFAALFGIASIASAQIVGVNGINSPIARDGYGGVYEINGQNYWWMCIEPNSSGSAGPGQGFIAEQMGFEAGWDQQNQERLDFYTANPGYYTSAIPKQVAVMQYVLDTYLPWNLSAGAVPFETQNIDTSNFGTNDAFYNAFFTVQNFISESYGKIVKEDFTTMGDYTFYAGNATGDVLATQARLDLFNAILADVAGKDAANFFASYTAQGTYQILNSLYSINNVDINSPDYNWQDALLLVTPAPEPSGALLIGCTGLAMILRRMRRLA